ncbi:glycoside hydrolase family 99-like domain-containing protein [Pseudomonadota bacterium]
MNLNSYESISENDVHNVLSTGLFDANYYLRTYPDVFQSGLDPLRHYLYFGHKENRNPSLQFDTEFYRSQYMPEGGQCCPLIHLVMHDDHDGVKLRSDNSIEIDISETKLGSSPSLAIQVHLYYPEIFEEVAPRLKALPSNIDLLISTSSEQKRKIIEQKAKLVSLENRIELRTVKNVGRDLAPLFVGFADAWSRYDYICHLHSKKSPHTDFGHRWRNYLFDQLIGSRSLISAIISLFERDKAIGMVYPDNYFEIKRFIGWNGNEHYTSEFLKKVGFHGFELSEESPEFSAGSMSWMRTDAYTPLNQELLKVSDFEVESNQQEGTLAHVLERCLTIIPQLNGFRTCKYFNDIQDVDAYRAAWSKPDKKPEAGAGTEQARECKSFEDRIHANDENTDIGAEPTPPDLINPVSYSGSAITKDDFHEIQEKKNLVISKLDQYLTEVSTTSAELEHLTNEVRAHLEQEKLVHRENQRLHEHVLNQQSTIEKLASENAEFRVLAKDWEQKESHIASLVSSVSGLEDLLNRNATEAARVSGELTDLQREYTALESSLVIVKKQKKKLKKNVASLVEGMESKNAALVNEIEQKNQQIESLNLNLEAHSSELRRLQRELADHVESIEKIGKTLSWKITAPLRFVVDWMALYPLHLVKKGSGKLFKLRSPVKPDISNIDLINDEVAERKYVERAANSPPAPLSSRLIAFYLPQFHPIPENDEWWGKGFTEWTNVSKAKPLFPQHYQPRVPGDLGYYDLRDVKVQEKQVELAEQYGLGGFCFYFYWFHGERLLETPLLQYLENQDLDLPFCLCWANENWTRTWDGKDGHVLIGQEYSEKDDLAFIEYLSKYLTNSRYIRVEGKPLILVYRPSLLPDPAQTAHKWRKWCIDNGIGEIYLAYTQSFEKVDPVEIGFDAAIEFPPNNTGPEIVTAQVKDLSFGFKGFVYDWTSIASRSEAYMPPDYTLFRGVTPCWDNTARRHNTGAVFVGNTPSRYQSWLENAIIDTQERFEDPSKQLVFINAWNEWAEGAYLEPDAAYGYAYLQATKNALENTSPAKAQ